MASTKNVLMIGFHPDVPGPLSPAEVSKGLYGAKAQLDELGYLTDLCLVMNGPGDAALVEDALRAKTYDCVCIGAGVRIVPEHTVLFEKLINIVHRGAPPDAKLCFNVNPPDTVNAVRRGLAS